MNQCHLNPFVVILTRGSRRPNTITILDDHVLRELDSTEIYVQEVLDNKEMQDDHISHLMAQIFDTVKILSKDHVVR